MPEFAQAMSRLSVSEMSNFAELVELPPEIGDFTEEDGSETEEQEEERRIPMLKLVAQLTAAQKVALALKGNREARTILIRDSNRWLLRLRCVIRVFLKPKSCPPLKIEVFATKSSGLLRTAVKWFDHTPLNSLSYTIRKLPWRWRCVF